MGRLRSSESAIAGSVLRSIRLVEDTLTVGGWRDGERCGGGDEACRRDGSRVMGWRLSVWGGYMIGMVGRIGGGSSRLSA